MKGNKTLISAIYSATVLLLTLTLLTGCANKEINQGPATSAASALKQKVNPKNAIKTVIYQNGREIKIPKEINRVVIASIPLPSLYYVVTGSCDNIVGVPRKRSKVEYSMLYVLAPELMNVSTNFIKGTDVNMEELLRLRPDMVFFGGGNPKQDRQFEAVGIPAVGVYIVKGGNAMESLHLWLKLLGRVFDKEARASELIAHDEKTMEMIHSRVRAIPQEKKPKALILFSHSEKQIVVSGNNNNFGRFWLNSTGAIDVTEATNIAVMGPVNMEQIYKWNPDIIYISNFSNTPPEDLIQNAIEGQDWSKVKAIKERKVYKIPSGIYRWYAPSADASLMLKWMAQIHHPELFSDYDIKEEIRRHYLRFYNYNLSSEQVEGILHPVHAAAKRRYL
jgi:iron complex transport system substrate-binding protein